MRLCLSLDLPEDAALLSNLRRAVRASLALCHVVERDIDELELIVGELATNAVCHAHADLYRVSVEVEEWRATITVMDKGDGFLRDKVALPLALRPNCFGEDRIGGLGLPLVEFLADEVTLTSTHPKGMTIRAVKYLQAP